MINGFLEHMRCGIPQKGGMYFINNYICYNIETFNVRINANTNKTYCIVLQVNPYHESMPKLLIAEPYKLKPLPNRNLFKADMEKLKSFSESLTNSINVNENNLAIVEDAYVYAMWDDFYAVIDLEHNYNTLSIGNPYYKIRQASNGLYYDKYLIVSDKEYKKKILAEFLDIVNRHENGDVPNRKVFRALRKQLGDRIITKEDRLVAISLLKYKLKNELGICNYE